jgi:hypothetical protein
MSVNVNHTSSTKITDIFPEKEMIQPYSRNEGNHKADGLITNLHKIVFRSISPAFWIGRHSLPANRNTPIFCG